MQRDTSPTARTADDRARHARTPATGQALLAATLVALVPVFAVWAVSYPALAAAALSGAAVSLGVGAGVTLLRRRRRRLRIPTAGVDVRR